MAYHTCTYIGAKYKWDTIPANLKTKTMLRQERLRPKRGAEPVAYVQGGLGAYDLYDIACVVPMRTATDAQKEALKRGRRIAMYGKKGEALSARIAGICGFDAWEVWLEGKEEKQESNASCCGIKDGIEYGWCIDMNHRYGQLQFLKMGEVPEERKQTAPAFTVAYWDGEWVRVRGSDLAAFRQGLARLIYALDIGDEDLIEAVNYPLDMHEKMEIHLSVPREFWPPKWIEEVKEHPS